MTNEQQLTTKNTLLIIVTIFAISLFLPFSAQARDITTEVQRELGETEAEKSQRLQDERLEEFRKSQPAPAPTPAPKPGTQLPVKTPEGGTPLPTRTPTSGGGQTITIPNPLQAGSFEDLVVALNRWLLVIAGPILTLMIIIGAFQIMTGAGNPEKITQGRHTITYAIIGFALLLISSGITFIIKEVLGTR